MNQAPEQEPAVDVDVARAARGDTAAFERVYRAHVNHVYSLSRRLLGASLAEQATQDVFVRVWHHLRSFRAEASFATWLERITLNVIASRQRETPAAETPAAEQVARVEAAGSPHDWRLDFEAAIARLPPGAREVFVLHDIHGHLHQEIAELLAISLGTSKSQLHRARMLLREVLHR
jgi:RNA polymerase sigma-70 factor (ECF subfamily)